MDAAHLFGTSDGGDDSGSAWLQPAPPQPATVAYGDPAAFQYYHDASGYLCVHDPASGQSWYADQATIDAYNAYAATADGATTNATTNATTVGATTDQASEGDADGLTGEALFDYLASSSNSTPATPLTAAPAPALATAAPEQPLPTPPVATMPDKDSDFFEHLAAQTQQQQASPVSVDAGHITHANSADGDISTSHGQSTVSLTSTPVSVFAASAESPTEPAATLPVESVETETVMTDDRHPFTDTLTAATMSFSMKGSSDVSDVDVIQGLDDDVVISDTHAHEDGYVPTMRNETETENEFEDVSTLVLKAELTDSFSAEEPLAPNDFIDSDADVHHHHRTESQEELDEIMKSISRINTSDSHQRSTSGNENEQHEQIVPTIIDESRKEEPVHGTSDGNNEMIANSGFTDSVTWAEFGPSSRSTNGTPPVTSEKQNARSEPDLQLSDEADRMSMSSVSSISHGDQIVCTSCRRRNDGDANFCSKCGQKITRVSDSGQPTQAIPTSAPQTSEPTPTSAQQPQYVAFYDAQGNLYYYDPNSTQPIYYDAYGNMYYYTQQQQETVAAAAAQQYQTSESPSAWSQTSVATSTVPYHKEDYQQSTIPYSADQLQQQHYYAHEYHHDQHVVAQKATPVSEPVFHDPLGRKPRAVVTFGFGGQLVLVFPQQQQRFDSTSQSVITTTKTGPLTIRSIADVLAETELFKSLKTWPGPLRKSTETELLKRLDVLISETASAYTSNDNVLLWTVLKLLVEHQGQLISNPKAEAHVRAALLEDRSQLSSFANDATSSTGLIGGHTRSDTGGGNALAEMEGLLLVGQRQEALQCAISGGLWAHALVLASTLPRPVWGTTLAQFASTTFSPGDPAKMLFLALAQSQGSTVPLDAMELVNRWREHAAMLLSNRTQTLTTNSIVSAAPVGTQTNSVSIVSPDVWSKLAEKLSISGRPAAAHVCLILSDSNYVPVSLVGSRQQTLSPHSFDILSVQRTEIAEYAMSLRKGSSPRAFLWLAPTKLLYASLLADMGLHQQAAAYVESLLGAARSLQAQPNPPKYLAILAACASELLARLKAFGVSVNAAPDAYGGDGTTGSSWFSSGIRTLLDRGLDLVIGDGEQKMPNEPSQMQQQPVHAPPRSMTLSSYGSNVSTIATAMPVSSMSRNSFAQEQADEDSVYSMPKKKTETKVGSATSTPVTTQDSPKKPAGDAKTEGSTEASPGFFGRIGGLLFGGKKRVEVNLGEEMQFKYDPVLKQWVNSKGELPPSAAPPPPPPKASSISAIPVAHTAAAPSREQQPSYHQPLQPQTQHPLQSQPMHVDPRSAQQQQQSPGQPMTDTSVTVAGGRRKPTTRPRYVDVMNPNASRAAMPTSSAMMLPQPTALAALPGAASDAIETFQPPRPQAFMPAAVPTSTEGSSYSYYASSDFQNDHQQQQERLQQQLFSGNNETDVS